MFRFLKIKKFVESINPRYIVHFSNCWSSAWWEEEIWVPINRKKQLDGDKEYLDFIESKYHFRPNTYIISLLHEIGHLQTETEDLSNARAVEYYALETAFDDYAITKEEYYNQYFQIEAEILATNWAVNYYKNNSEIINKLIKDLKLGGNA